MDGSYSGTLENYSYGLVATYSDDLVHCSMCVGNNEEMRSQLQIDGELLGAMKVIAYAINNGHLIQEENFFLGMKRITGFFHHYNCSSLFFFANVFHSK